MKFVQRDLGSAAEASSGGRGPGWLREVLLMGGALLALTLGLWLSIGWLTELVLPLVSTETEKKLFGSLQLSALVTPEKLPPDLARRHENAARILARLAADPASPPLNYRLVVVNGEEPNAFAFPGGTIGVTGSLLELIEDEVALAFVLGHELGHCAQRDHLRGVGRQFGRSLVWALVFGGDVDGDLLSTHVSALLDLQHSRRQESTADIFGLELVHRIYGTTEGTDRLFVWLEQRDRHPAWLAMLQTHPQPAGRLTALRAHMARLTTQSR